MGCENKSFLNIFLKKLYAKLYLMATVLYANFCLGESDAILSNPMVPSFLNIVNLIQSLLRV